MKSCHEMTSGEPGKFQSRQSRPVNRPTERHPHLGKESGLFCAAGDPHPLEITVEPDVHIEVTGIFVEVQERPRSPREITALALMQLGELTQFQQQCLDVIKVVGCRMPHSSRMTVDVTAPQGRSGYGVGRSQQKRRNS